MITVDREKCTGCGVCGQVCVDHALEWDKESRTVSVRQEELCNHCGHCIAVCPSGAIEHNNIAMQGFSSLEDFQVEPQQIENFLRSKRSVRHFQKREVAPEVIDHLIRVAESAPSDNNRQEREYIVVTDPKKIAQLEEATVQYYRQLMAVMTPFVRRFLSLFAADSMRELEKVVPDFEGLLERDAKGEKPVFHGAPCVILLHAPKGNVMAKDNCIAAQQYLMLQAQAMGLGSCIIGYASAAPKSLAKTVEIPKGNEIVAVMTLGYPRYTYKRTPPRQEKRIKWYKAGESLPKAPLAEPVAG